MKQSKKLTRNQRQFLQKKKINTEPLRVLEENPFMIKVINIENEQITVVEKGA